MPVITAEILFKHSVVTGSAGNSNAGTPAGSLGKYISTTELTDASLNNLFNDMTGDENADGDDKYRCIFVHNSNATLTLSNIKVWFSAEVANGADAAIAIDDIAASAIGSGPGAQADEIADEDTAPSGESFSAPTSKATGLDLGDLQAGYCRAIWVRITGQDSAALADDGVTIRVEGDTPA